MAIGNSFAERFDGPISFGMMRFQHDEHSHLWRFYVSEYCAQRGDALLEIDADVKALIAMRRFLDRAIEAVNTDGGRIEP